MLFLGIKAIYRYQLVNHFDGEQQLRLPFDHSAHSL